MKTKEGVVEASNQERPLLVRVRFIIVILVSPLQFMKFINESKMKNFQSPESNFYFNFHFSYETLQLCQTWRSPHEYTIGNFWN